MSESTVAPVQVPLTRKLWFVVTLTCLILTFPIAMIILATGDVYRWRDHGWHPIGKGARYSYAGFLALWLVAAGVNALIHPDVISDASQKVNQSQAGGAAPAQSVAQAEAPKAAQEGIGDCTSSATIEAVKAAIEENGAKVLDFGKAQETLNEPNRKLRRCVAEAALNTGQTIVTYQTYFGPSGKPLVQVQTGQTAAMQYEVDKAKKEELAETNKPQPADQPATENQQPDPSTVKADDYDDKPAK